MANTIPPKLKKSIINISLFKVRIKIETLTKIMLHILPLILNSGRGIAQLRNLDFEALNAWPYMLTPTISENGKYIFFQYYNRITGTELHISSSDGKLHKIVPGGNNPLFTQDSRHLIFELSTGINILNLETGKSKYILHATQFDIPKSGNGEWLTYRQNDTLTVYNIKTGKKRKLGNTRISVFNGEGTVLVFNDASSLKWLDLANLNEKEIYRDDTLINVVFNRSGDNVAFITSKGTSTLIHIYSHATQTTKILAKNDTKGIMPDYLLSNDIPSFSSDGHLLFIKLKKLDKISSDTAVLTDKVDIWHYQDRFLQTQQLQDLPSKTNKRYKAVINIATNFLVQLECKNIILTGIPGNKYAIVSNVTNSDESYWNQDNIPQYSLIRINDGVRVTLPKLKYPTNFIISPGEKYILWADGYSKKIFCYEILRDTIRELTNEIPSKFFNEKNSRYNVTWFQKPSWLFNDSLILLYDQYNIWQVDPRKPSKFINLTNEYSHSHRISFRVIEDISLDNSPNNKTLFLTALDTENKNNGFFKLEMDKRKRLSVLIPMQPQLLYYPGYGKVPIRAKKANVYLIQQCKANISPTLLTIRNFKNVVKLRCLQPQQTYNWMTSELLTWQMKNGKKNTGILYKPSNFDSTRKYPVIFSYYEQRSEELHQFINPGLSIGDLNIPWYVNHGYLIFIPDVHHPTGLTTESIVNTIMSSAEYVSGLKYVDKTKLGLQGHSFGGYETLLLITQSNLFKAAQASSAPTNLSSLYGGIGFGGKSLNAINETGQNNLGASLWDHPELYINNSPVFFANKINTPLMMMHNKRDDNVPFTQGIEMFTALRRLKKKVWLLQYDNEGHIITNTENQMDFTIRQQQFFDHFLKDVPAPSWLENGIPAEKKGQKSGLSIITGSNNVSDSCVY